MIKRIPAGFYDDHINRSLPAPHPVRQTRVNVWIDIDDPAFEDLLSDAKWYASLAPSRRDPDMNQYIRMARNLLKSLQPERSFKIT